MAKRKTLNDPVTEFTHEGRTLKKGDLIFAYWEGFFVVEYITPRYEHAVKGEDRPQVFSRQVATGNGKPRKSKITKHCSFGFCYLVTAPDREGLLERAADKINNECDRIEAVIRKHT